MKNDRDSDFPGQRIIPWRIGILILSLSITAGSCGEKTKTATSVSIPVKVMEVRARLISRTLDYVGDIQARDAATAYSKVSGKIVEKLKEEGSRVNQDDIIATVDRDEVGFKFETAVVESPLAGVIGRVYVDRGTQITPQTPVALVVNMEQVEIDLDIPEKHLPEVEIGQTAHVTVDAYPGEDFVGKVARISPVVDRQTRTAPVVIAIENPGHKLKPGMFARVSLVIEERADVPVIRQEAVLAREINPSVFVIEDGTARKQPVELGLRDGPYWEVTVGLSAGDKVVTMGQQRLRDGDEVSVEEE
jgi:membrane fusion protein (multidrug efflux system)